MALRIDLTGKQFGRLTVIGRRGGDFDKHNYWLCLCSCGAKTIVRTDNLRSGRTRSCGCATTKRYYK